MSKTTPKIDPDEILLYTDGACSGNPGPGGWAYVLIHPATESVKKDSQGVPNTTNNRMELQAVIEGLKAVKKTRKWKVRVFSDSEYVVLGMSQWLPKWLLNNWRRGSGRDSSPVKNADLWRELYGLSQQFDTRFEHVRGHMGHEINEECDRMAVQAIKRLRRGEEE